MFRKFFAGFFATAFIIVFVSVVFIMGVYNVLGDKDFYTDGLADGTYDIFVSASPSFFKEGDFSSLSGDDIKAIMQKVLSKEDFKVVVAEIYDSLSGAEFKSGKLDIVVPMDWFLAKKDTLVAEFADILFKDLKDVDVAKIDYQSQLAQDLNNQLFTDVPADLIFTMDVPEDVEGGVTTYFNHIFDLFLSAVWMLLLVVLMIVALLVFKPWYKVLCLEFKTLFLASLFSMITLFILLFLSNFILGNSYTDVVVDMDGLQLGFYDVFISSLFSAVFWKLFFPVLACIVVSLVLWILLIRYDNEINGKGTNNIKN